MSINIGKTKELTLISGPCAIESEKMSMSIAEHICEITQKLPISYIFKASFDKANRSSINSERGIGIEKGLKILRKVRENFNIPVITDVHEDSPMDEVADAVDIIQTPAFLCRQTNFIIKVASTMKPVNIKKGQFLSPKEMINVVKKAKSTGNNEIYVCERGASFGYNNLVSDMRSLVILRDTGCPVVFDASHSVQQPGALTDHSGGESEFIPVLARAAVAVGVDALFIETHPEPSKAISDGKNSLNINDLNGLLNDVIKINSIIKENME
ncbi:MAG: 3-deoxy-8-phosphooctulonate synthase [Gammaproteobacteria bacterium]|jgi:2-dehydro-3-deoxyphosphooctonate aldolase (KDO 8-P synthase)|nr:3-deoxy-8-phosphooctulonate synthase [Gammaproteobacteria bacterium]MBT4462121.1 3-deoxy-8-phosphooctulonate synthase [Gammaproteobacteria bacterium]MBT4654980.1 3-deoxy-8-phosphooctulonate synthase [Gammaproteobacteria bacterium]MBT5116506.1 3-deoxy-8-phosphooctulonate synthase [Gammaproteobacteria bacterium]MBT5761535.1 3-deoxy-8-phosphooctulonate synthase [Gammaproteobacteria bacterium]